MKNTTFPEEITTLDTQETHLGTLRFIDGIPDEETTEKVYDHLQYVHAVNAFMDGFGSVSMFAIRKGLLAAGIKDNDVILFSGLMDSNSLFLTANADTVYFITFVDLGKGPMVVEAPPLSLGLIDDMTWRWVTDVSLPGPDRGAGGKYLILPPGYQGPLPEGGYFTSQSRTTRVCLLGRSFLENDSPKPAVERIKATLRIYPYAPGHFGTSIGSILAGGAAPTPPWNAETWVAALKPHAAPRFIEGTGKSMNTIPPDDASFYDMLYEAVQAEPAEALDPEIAGSFAAIGIVKGKPFNPDARMKKILAEAAAVGNAASRVVGFRPHLSEGFRYYGKSSSWTNPLFVGGYEFLTPPPQITPQGVQKIDGDGARKLHARSSFFYIATGITPAMCMRLTEIGSQYLMSYMDSKGKAYDGANTYKVILPKGIPAGRFWSFTVYDNQSRSMLQTEQKFPRSGSQGYPTPAAKAGSDGSTIIYFGPTRPEDVEEGNWIQTVPGKGWFPILRLYSPQEPFFDKSWKPGEIEEV